MVSEFIEGIQSGINVAGKQQEIQIRDATEKRNAADAMQQMQMRAVDIARKQEEVAQKKLEVKNAKFTQFLNKMQRVVGAPKGRMRNFLVEDAKNWSLDMDYPVHPELFELAADESNRTSVSKAIGMMLGIDDPDKFAQAADMAGQYIDKPAEFFQKAAEQVAEFEQNKAKAEVDANAKRAERDQKAAEIEDKKLSELFDISRKDKRVDDFNKISASYDRIRASALGVKPGIEITEDGKYLERQEDGSMKEVSKKEATSGAADVDMVASMEAAGVDLADLEQNAFNDLSLVFNFMKMLDPNSVVRESEFESAQAGTSPFFELGNKFYAQLTKGKRALSPKQRKKLLDSAKTQKIAADKQYASFQRKIFDEAKARGVDLNKVAQGLGVDVPARLNAAEQLIQKLVAAGHTQEAARNMVNERVKQIKLAKQRMTKNQRKNVSGPTK